jgi:hypothetical protein
MYHQGTGIFVQIKGEIVGNARHWVAALVKVDFLNFLMHNMGLTHQNLQVEKKIKS